MRIQANVKIPVDTKSHIKWVTVQVIYADLAAVLYGQKEKGISDINEALSNWVESVREAFRRENPNMPDEIITVTGLMQCW